MEYHGRLCRRWISNRDDKMSGPGQTDASTRTYVSTAMAK